MQGRSGSHAGEQYRLVVLQGNSTEENMYKPIDCPRVRKNSSIQICLLNTFDI